MLPVHRTGSWGLRDYGVDGQLGLEKTPEEYIAKMVEVFREVWRVLRDDGTLWLNMGDTYWGGKGQSGSGGKEYQQLRSAGGLSFSSPEAHVGGRGKTKPQDENHPNYKPKDLCGIPWRLALALQADGWYLRQDIIWHKPNPMPESVTDRCTKAHEYIFLLTKKPRYYFDADAIKEDSDPAYFSRYNAPIFTGNKEVSGQGRPGGGSNTGGMKPVYTTRNKRSVWTVPTAPYKEAHFATFPPKLIEPCILAGCPQWVCKKCGEPRWRIMEPIGDYKGKSKFRSCTESTDKVSRFIKENRMRLGFTQITWEKQVRGGKSTGLVHCWETEIAIPTPKHWRGLVDIFGCDPYPHLGLDYIGDAQKMRTDWLTEGVRGPKESIPATTKTTGWTDCGCNAGFAGGVVLDPFMGSGTVGLVAYQNNRHYIGIELNPEYCKLKRIKAERDKYGLFEGLDKH